MGNSLVPRFADTKKGIDFNICGITNANARNIAAKTRFVILLLFINSYHLKKIKKYHEVPSLGKQIPSWYHCDQYYSVSALKNQEVVLLLLLFRSFEFLNAKASLHLLLPHVMV